MTPPVTTIIAAMEDRKLFGAHFRKPLFRADSWAPWKTFLKTLYALPMSEQEFLLYGKCTGRTVLPSVPFREAFVPTGRRGGKSHVAALVGVYEAVFVPHDLNPGTIGVVLICAQDRAGARTIFNYIENFFATIPMLSKMVVSQTKTSIDLNNGTRIEIATSDSVAVRGYTIICFIGDEVAHWPVDANAASPDIEVLRAVRPGTLTTHGLIFCVSSPYARRGVLFEAHKDNFGNNASDVLVWNATTEQMNPLVDKKAIQREYQKDPLSAASEYGAQFRDDISGFLTREIIEACTIRNRRELPPAANQQYFAFVDMSGGIGDSMTLAIAHNERDRAVMDCLREVVAPCSPEGAVTQFVETLKRYRISDVTGDHYAGEWPREQFEKRGVSYRPSDQNRSELYLNFLPMLNSGQVELLDLPRIGQQFANLDRKPGRLRDVVDHRAGAHDDVANVVAGAAILALGNSGITGFLDWVKTSAAAALDAIATPARNLIAFPGDFRKEFAAVWHANQQRIDEERAALAVPSESCCPVCQSAEHVTRVNDFLRCSRDGVQFGYLHSPGLVVLPTPAHEDPNICSRCGGPTRHIHAAPSQCIVCGFSKPLTVNPAQAGGARR